jgi:hypothetical protein
MSILILVTIGLSLLSPIPIQDDDIVIEEATKTEFTRTLGENPTIELLGLAHRSRYFVKVYGIALYAEREPLMQALGEGEADEDAKAEAVLASTGRRALVMKFVRDVGADKIRDAFRDGIELTIKIDDPLIAEDAVAFLEKVSDVKKGDTAEILIEGDGTTTLLGNGEELIKVCNPHLAKAILATHLGQNPVDKNIKKNLLKFF